MSTLFMICAAVGGTILVLQFLLNLVGLGSEAFTSVDVPDEIVCDIPDGDAAVHHASTAHQFETISIVKRLTFQTVTAFLAFFGIGGLATLYAGKSSVEATAIGIACGIGSMIAIGYVMQLFVKLEADPTVRLAGAVGSPARVYLRIPANDSGAGKVTVCIQNRTLEVKATTPGPELPTGSNVIVNRMLGEDTFEVVAAEPGDLQMQNA